jgi:RHS repeat-associated protein
MRYAYGTTVTDKLYTGQQQETEIGLSYYIARFYDPVIAHFIQPDSLIPQASASASYDRYAYVNGNPINFNDPSGHCPLCVSAAIGAGIGAVVGAVGYSIYAATSGTEFNWGHFAIATGGGLAAGALIGTGVGWAAGVSQATATTAAITTAGVAESANKLCGGDMCASEINDANKVIQGSNQSVWQLNPLIRGIKIENILGRSSQLSNNFPVIDRFENGVATSVKSLDLTAKTYQNASNLTSKVMSYGNTLLNWQGTNPQGWAGTVISKSMIQTRILQLAIPTTATPNQLITLQKIQSSLFNSGVLFQIATIK